ncbi:hypothetical protein PIB30_063371 [Stylosanthes scabra]|uniref:Uncharacterized protein n=1 Tax=Stylosanthes scabra TaxID=79078 RepID=A0ABU6UN36_9FABA|nr:hypothetical protein [Stylosanthes scabra]
MPSNKKSLPSVASNSNLSPSPRRSSEISNPMRKSFAGNPFSKPSLIANPATARSVFPNTPANSPSDFQRKNSVPGRESGGSLRYVDDKENAKDQTLKPGKARSPAACLKGSKNFMSPTISASCKIIESPRKKVLVERNEPVPDSVPSAEAKSNVRKVTFAEPLECVDLISDHLDLEERKLDYDDTFDGVPNFEESHSSCLTSEEDLSDESETVFDISVPLVPNSDTDLSFQAEHDLNVPLVLEDDKIETEPPFETVSLDHDCVNLDPTFKLSPTPPPASSTAPLDADPSLPPPYDPKTNYLSPRPQFLHYKPRPRMDLCSEGIISGSFSDSEVTEDTQSEASQKEAEEVSSDETVTEEVSQSSEPSPAEGTIEAKEVPKRRFSMRSKAFGLIFLLSFAFLSISVINSPEVFQHTVFEDMYEAYEASQLSEFARDNFDHFTQFAEANFHRLARNFHIWFVKSLTTMSELISNVRGLHIHSLAKLQYYNLTLVPDHDAVNQYNVFGGGKNEVVDVPKIQPTVVYIQESEVISDIDTDEEDSEDVSEEHYEIYEEQVKQELGIATEVESDSDAPQSEESLQMAEAGNSDAKQEQEGKAYFNVEGVSETEEVLEGQAAIIIEPEQALQQAEAENSEAMHAQFEEIHTEVYDEEEAEGNYVTADAAIPMNEKISDTTSITPHTVLYLLLCGGAVIIIAGVSFMLSRKGNIRSKRVTSSVVQPLISKELYANNSLQTLNKMQISPEKSSLRSGPMEMDVLELEEPCPSEMSSFQEYSSQGNKVMKQSDEDHSLEKKRKKHYRRESWASSDYSMGSSSSYGSLTVYEKIPSKQGDGNVGTVTPVRRSSRLRNLATSPS